jgi:ABC-type antimicrobial peptide transport system permease subunit
MATAGQASIHAAIGFALLAPLLVRTIAGQLSRPLERAGASGCLTAHNVRQRTQHMASALVPIILFTATTGALYMQSIENAAPPVVGTSTSAAEAENIETLNFVVVGMIAAFAAIILINTLVAATTHRRQEFAQLRLAGATPPQVLRMVSLESIVLLVTGVVFGTIGALFTIVPYSIARTGSLVPNSTAAIYLGVVGAAAVLALASGLSPVRRAIRAPAIEAVGA